jgi:hypothetical protein
MDWPGSAGINQAPESAPKQWTLLGCQILHREEIEI